MESSTQLGDGGVNFPLPEEALCNELVDLYFDIMHDKQHALFHRPTFIADQRQGRAPMVLVWAMIALAARCVLSLYDFL
jgi:Fungal specific transcription factor domain